MKYIILVCAFALDVPAPEFLSISCLTDLCVTLKVQSGTFFYLTASPAALALI